MHHLGQAVGEGDDGVETTGGLGKLGDEVHCDLIPTVFWSGQRLEEASGGLVAWLGALAGRAGLDVIADGAF